MDFCQQIHNFFVVFGVRVLRLPSFPSRILNFRPGVAFETRNIANLVPGFDKVPDSPYKFVFELVTLSTIIMFHIHLYTTSTVCTGVL